jgi:RHS repeat-associated protein
VFTSSLRQNAHIRRFLRVIATITILCFLPMALQAPVQAAVNQAQKAYKDHQVQGFSAIDPTTLAGKIKLAYLKLVAQHQTGAIMATPRRVNLAALEPYAPTLLDEVGYLSHPVPAVEWRGWKTELLTSHPTASRAALLRIELGEYALAQDEQPELAIQSFRQAQSLVKKNDPLYGLAAYDSAIAICRMGAYEQAAQAFHHLLGEKLTGFPIATCAFWYKHTSACAGYHAEHAALGIPEPTRLDPLCAAAALAASLRSFGLPYDKKVVLGHVLVTGEGSNLQDVINAGPKLGVNVRPITATDKGLMALPKPIVAYVERDHFVSVIAADKKGVSYLCSDCGPWPGGEVDLTWKQWHAMAPGIYGVVTRPGSLWDQAIQEVLSGKKAPAVKVASTASLQAAVALARAIALLKGNVIGNYIGANQTACASVTGTQHCPEPPKGVMYCCFKASGGPGPGTGPGSGTGTGPGSGSGGAQPWASTGPSAGDPVNLATGEEEYRPDPDFTVYNPVGPSVTWQRVYNHLRPIASTYDWFDFGPGWSQTYNVNVYDPAIRMTVAPSHSNSCSATGTDQPAGSGGPPPAWDIVNPSGTVIANANTPNGWTASGTLIVSPATGLHPTEAITVTAPSGASTGNGYEVRIGYTSPSSAFFDVVSSTSTYNVDSKAGTKYVVLDNGARVSFSAPSVPSSTNTTVACTPQAGAPFLVEWDYDTNSPAGHFKVTFNDRTQYLFNYPEANTYDSWLGQIVDRNGNAITFHYGASVVATSSPVLSSISNSAGTTLLSIARSSSVNDQITSVSDCYGRSIYYQESAEGNSSSYQYDYVSQASEIVATGTSSPPARYTYGYTNYLNGEGDPLTNLHTITVPSPTGSGTSTATINYNTESNYVTSIVDGNGNQQIFTQGSGNTTVVTVKNSSGTTIYSYTAGFNSAMSGTTMTDGAGTTISTSTYSDPNDPYQPSSVKDGNGNIWSYTWDKYGNMTSETTPRSTTTSYTISYSNFALGEVTEIQEGTKSPTYYAYYEPSGLTETVTEPLPGTTGSSSTVEYSYTYDSLGNLLTETTPAASNTPGATITTTFNYTSDPGNSTYGISSYSQSDAINQPLTMTDNLGKVMHFRYDSQGNPSKVIDAIGDEIDHSVNIANQPLQDTYPATGQSGSGQGYQLNTYLYPGGPLTTETTYDESNTQVAEVMHGYGKEGEMLSMAGSTAPITFTYDAIYRLATLKDGNSHTTSYSYNAAGYLSEIVYPGASSTTTGSADTVSYTSYDNDGNPTKRIDGNNVETDSTYADAESKLTKMHYPGGGLSDVTFSYDSYGRRSTMGDGTGSQTYTYDDLDNLLSDTTSFTSGPSGQAVSYTFYPNGSRETMVTPAGTFTYDYDGDARPSSITNPFSETTNWAYQDNWWLSTQTLGNGAVTAYTYNALGEITDLKNKTSSGTTLSDFGSMAYNGIFDRTTMTASMPAHTAYGGTTTYSYDSISGTGTREQLTREASTRDGSYTNNFAYDSGSYSSTTGAGNPTTMRGNTSTFNSDNQLTNTGFSYDGNGNPTTYNSMSLTFDPENRLTAYGSVMSAGYNGDGLRSWKQNSGGTTYYVYGGFEPICEENSSGTVEATNTFGPDGLLSRNASSTSVFYTFDPQGSVAQRLDSSQNVLTSHIYDSFGAGASSGSFTDPFGFAARWGYYTDQETGLILCTHRYYDPSMGRFVTRDPVGYDDGPNDYTYVKNNPNSGVDPLGLGVYYCSNPPRKPKPPANPCKNPNSMACCLAKAFRFLNAGMIQNDLALGQCLSSGTDPNKCEEEAADRALKIDNIYREMVLQCLKKYAPVGGNPIRPA